MRLGRWLMVLVLGSLCASCGSSLDMSKIHVGPNNTVSWEDAQTIIRDGDVAEVYQAHSLSVGIGMKNGTTYRTKEPKIDMVIDCLKQCGKWGKVPLVTE